MYKKENNTLILLNKVFIIRKRKFDASLFAINLEYFSILNFLIPSKSYVTEQRH